MNLDSATVCGRSIPARSRVTNDPRKLLGVDGGTANGRRRLDLIDAFMAALGGVPSLSEAQCADVRRAAELMLIAEEARAQALRGELVDLSGLVRIEGAADRAGRRLGIIKPAAKPHVSLREQLAEEAA